MLASSVSADSAIPDITLLLFPTPPLLTTIPTMLMCTGQGSQITDWVQVNPIKPSHL